jgi:hypothetical protein
MSPGITEELLARQPPEAQAIIRSLLADKCGIEGEDRGVGTAGEGQNTAKLLAAAQHATSARPAKAVETKIQEETWWATRP